MHLTEHQNTLSKTNGIEGRTRRFNNNSEQCQYSTFNPGQNNQTESQQWNRKLEQHYTPTRPKRHLSIFQQTTYSSTYSSLVNIKHSLGQTIFQDMNLQDSITKKKNTFFQPQWNKIKNQQQEEI